MEEQPPGDNSYDDVCVLLPVLNEAAIIGDLIRGFKQRGFRNVLVLDGGSTDGTREVAEDEGARVVSQRGRGGKGQAIREAFEHIEAPYILMADGDGTYRPEDADTMLDPLLSGEAEHVIGNRFADKEPGAMTKLNHVGNFMIQRAFRVVHREYPGDILSGYRAFTRESVDRMYLTEEGFGIETEMTVECVKHGIETREVPIRYCARPEGTETKLNPFRDGLRIWLTLYSMAKTNNPFFYLGSVGVVALFVGSAIAAFVGYRWFVAQISHEVLALVAASAILTGIMLLLFGVLSDVVYSLHREQHRRIDRLADKVEESTAGAVNRTDDGREGQTAVASEKLSGKPRNEDSD